MQADWEILFNFFSYSIRAFTALFWGILLFFYSKRSFQNLPLGIIFTVIGLLYLRNTFVRFPALDACDVYNPLSYIILIFIAPFTIFYAWFAFGEKHSRKDYIVQFIPFATVIILWTALKLSDIPHIPFCYSITELLEYSGQYPLYVGFFLLMATIFIIQVFTYFSIALIKIIRVWKIYKSHKISTRSLKLLTVMDILFIFYPLICVVFMSYNNELHFGIIFNFFVTAVITALSVLNINLILPVKTDLGFINNPEQNIYISTQINIINLKVDNTDRQLALKIKELFEVKELYRLPHITLQDIASELGTNRTYVSSCINNHFNCNFKQLLIRYRIEAAKKLLLNSTLEINEIIHTVGFNTRASFYKAFKENICENTPPSEWRKEFLSLNS